MPVEFDLTELVALLTRIIIDSERDVVLALEESGVTARQLRHIEAIDRLERPTMGELAWTLNYSKPSVTVIVRELESLGLVEKHPAEHDRRTIHLELTPRGRRIADLHAIVHRRIAAIFSKTLEPEEVRALMLLLNKVFYRISRSHHHST